jgi:hypothetical protein
MIPIPLVDRISWASDVCLAATGGELPPRSVSTSPPIVSSRRQQFLAAYSRFYAASSISRHSRWGLWPWCPWENILWSYISHATMLPFYKFQILSGKKCWNKFVDVHKTCLYNTCDFQNQNQNMLRETKKTNCYVNNTLLSFCLFVTLFKFGLSFLFLLVYFKFGSQNSRGYKVIS